MRRREAAARGRLVALALRGSWRSIPPPPELTVAELGSITTLLIANGSAGLAWRAISGDTNLAESDAGRRLWTAWLQEVGRDAARHRDLVAVLQRTHGAGLDPVLIKGWSVARRYPGPGLRPSADIDLCLPPAQVARARQSMGDVAAAVDFDHREELDATTASALVERSIMVGLDDGLVRVPGPVDELRILCLHFLKHGGWRPLWLCDIALVCEQSPETVKRASSGLSRVDEYVKAAIGSARMLLAADCEVPFPPRWIGEVIRQEWGSTRVVRAHGPLPPLRPLRRFVGDLSGRFPNGVAATIAIGAPTTGLPRALVQVAAIMAGGRRYLRAPSAG